jgi:hypothetical protein
MDKDDFPWSFSFDVRKQFLSDDLLKDININEYSHARYSETIKAVPRLPGGVSVGVRNE